MKIYFDPLTTSVYVGVLRVLLICEVVLLSRGIKLASFEKDTGEALASVVISVVSFRSESLQSTVFLTE